MQIKKPFQQKTTLLADAGEICIVCKAAKHPLYLCSKFRSLPHKEMLTTLKENGLCMNCLGSGHFAKDCKSTSRCRKCQNPHHTLLHLDPKRQESATPAAKTTHSHVSRSIASNDHVLLMTCRVVIRTTDNYIIQARALLDSGSSTSFITEHLTQQLHLPRKQRYIQVDGIGGIMNKASRSVVQFFVQPLNQSRTSLKVEAIVLPKVTSNLPVNPIPKDRNWTHLEGIQLSDPGFDTPGRIDLLLGADIFSRVVRHGRRFGPPGSPSAFETQFGWVLSGRVCPGHHQSQITSYHALCLSGDEQLRKFWEMEEGSLESPSFSPEERLVMNHFQRNHYRDETGRFIVPLPKREGVEPLGESRGLAVKRFLSLEKSLRSKGQFQEFAKVVQEYFDMGHAEPVPVQQLIKPCEEVFYLPMHGVTKDTSTTTRFRVVFDASAKSSSGTSLNDQLLVGPTVHPPLIDVLLRFRQHRIALTTDVSRMYRAVLLPDKQRDLHRFVWRQNPQDPLKDYRMTRLTFGVSASSFAANMAVKQNAIDFTKEYPKAASIVPISFYVDDGLTGEDSEEKARELQNQLQALFARAGFLLRKWMSSEPDVLRHLEPHLLGKQPYQDITELQAFTKVL